MKIARILGTVTLNRCLPSFEAARLRLAVPMDLENLADTSDPDLLGTLVVWDELGSGQGQLIALSEGGEAAQPFRPELKPVDSYNAAILDTVDVKP